MENNNEFNGIILYEKKYGDRCTRKQLDYAKDLGLDCNGNSNSAILRRINKYTMSEAIKHLKSGTKVKIDI